MAQQRSEAEPPAPVEPAAKPEGPLEAARPQPGQSPGAPLRTDAVLALQRTAGNAAVARLVAGGRPPARVRAPAQILQRDDRKPPYGVVPAMEAEDKHREWWDASEKKRKPVWTPEGGYVKNPSAMPLKDAVNPKGRIGGGFDNGTYTYVVDAKGEVVIAKRMGEPGGAAGRATGMPHPTLIGGKNPTVLAAGEVEIRGGKIYRLDNQSGHFQPARKSMSASLKGFLKLPTSAFHPDFHAQSVHYDPAGARSTKAFRSVRMLKLKGRDLTAALRKIKPKALLGRMKSPGFRGRAGGFAALIALIALQYLLGKWTGKLIEDFIQKQIEELGPKIEEELELEEDALERLLEEDSEADIHVNVRLAIETWSDAEGNDSLPGVKLDSVGYSREPWDPTPIETWEMHCFSRLDRTIITHSEKLSPLDLFTDVADEAGVE
jgi:hypothetical protein